MQETASQVYIDHIDGNRLNNSRSNLRRASAQENAQNRKHLSHVRNRTSRRRRKVTSRFKGVTKQKSGRFKAQISIDKQVVYLGLFSSETDAALRYDFAAEQEYGEFARLNFDPLNRKDIINLIRTERLAAGDHI